MKTTLPLFLDWGIHFGKPYTLPERAQRPVAYADRQEVVEAILKKYPPQQIGKIPLSEKSESAEKQPPLKRKNISSHEFGADQQ